MSYALLVLVLVFFQLETVLYLAVNGVSSRLPGVRLLTQADQVLPARPGSIWLYLSFVPYCLLAALQLRSFRLVGRVLLCVALEALVSYRCFLKFPACYPRPAVREDGSRQGAAWHALHQADRPANTFPSVHVGHAFLLALVLARHLPGGRSEAVMLWAALISASTLTTKQHFLVDLAGGVLAAEAIASHVYEPWCDGRLSWREAWRALGRLCAQLDALARSPERARLRAAERHPCLRGFLARLERHGDLLALYAATRGRHRLLGQGRRLARLLDRARPALSFLTALVPGWLQFARQFQETAPRLSDRRLADYLREQEPDLRRALGLLFEPEAAPAPVPAMVLGPATRP